MLPQPSYIYAFLHLQMGKYTAFYLFSLSEVPFFYHMQELSSWYSPTNSLNQAMPLLPTVDGRLQSVEDILIH